MPMHMNSRQLAGMLQLKLPLPGKARNVLFDGAFALVPEGAQLRNEQGENIPLPFVPDEARVTDLEPERFACDRELILGLNLRVQVGDGLQWQTFYFVDLAAIPAGSQLTVELRGRAYIFVKLSSDEWRDDL